MTRPPTIRRRAAGAVASLILVALGATSAAPAQSVTLQPTTDFFTTRFAFSPYVRGNAEPNRQSIGVGTPNPFFSDTSGQDSFEETTYFQFSDLATASGGLPSSVPSAVLRVGTLARVFNGTTPVTPANPFNISAHRVTGDPLALIVPTAADGPGSYVEFKNTRIAATPESTVAVTGVGTFDWDVTALVNEWLVNGEANADFTIAMTARIGNDGDDSATSGTLHAFANRENAVTGANAARLIVTVPEPATLAAVAGAAAVIVRRRR